MREWLKKIRKDSNRTQREIASAASISQSYYEKIESGDRSVPVSTAKRIANALGFEWQKFYQ